LYLASRIFAIEERSDEAISMKLRDCRAPINRSNDHKKNGADKSAPCNNRKLNISRNIIFYFPILTLEAHNYTLNAVRSTLILFSLAYLF